VVPPSSDRMARVPPYSRTLARVSRTGLSPAPARRSRRFRYPGAKATGLFRVRSPLLTESRGAGANRYRESCQSRILLMSVPPATEMFQFAGFASRTYGFSTGYPRVEPVGGLPHSETPGSPIARISPGLFAACCVLRRLSVPRHPPDALTSRLITGLSHKGETASPPRTGPNPRWRGGPWRWSRMKTLLRTRPPS
jgi:hypothetical protein